MDAVKRRYHAPKREARAAATRQRILDAARGRLTGAGWAGTTMTSIASDAGVAVQTLYAVFGSKGAILAALLDDLEVAARSADAGSAGSDPVTQLRQVVAFNRRLFELAGELIDVAQGSRAVDPDLAANVAEGHRRRREAQRPLVDAWARRGVLREGVSAAEALLTLWTMTSPEVHRLATSDGAMTGDRYEAWLGGVLGGVLFGDPEAEGASG